MVVAPLLSVPLTLQTGSIVPEKLNEVLFVSDTLTAANADKDPTVVTKLTDLINVFIHFTFDTTPIVIGTLNQNMSDLSTLY